MYILDATCPLIHKSEKDLILSIFDQIKQNHQNNKYTRIAFIFNKVDDNKDQEIMELFKEATQWLKEKMAEKKIEVVDNWFLAVSFRKMMIYSINKYGNIDDVPEIILKRIEANKKKLKIDDLTNDENTLFANLKLFIEQSYNVEYISKIFSGMLNNIDVVYYTEIVKCINSHCHLRVVTSNNP